MCLCPKLENGEPLSKLLQRCCSFSPQFHIIHALYHYFVAAEEDVNEPNYQGPLFQPLQDFPLSTSLENLASSGLQEVDVYEELRNVVMNYNEELISEARYANHRCIQYTVVQITLRF